MGTDPARAQLSGSVSVASDDLLRGRSVSSGRPVGSLALSYDDPSGFYIDAAATASPTHTDEPALIGGTIDAGYSWRTPHGVAIDIGALRQHYTRYFSGGRSTGYTEVYAGISQNDLSARLSYAPDYLAANSHTLYLSVDRAIRLSDTWHVTAHAGGIAYLSPLHAPGLRTIEYDYGAAVTHRWQLFDIRLGLSSGGPDRDLYGGRFHAKTRMTIGSSLAF